MKKTFSGRLLAALAAITVLALISACSAPLGSGDPETPGSDASISGSIVNMPRLQAELPASLSSGDSTSSRAMGDVRSLTQANLPDVKAQGWYDMQDAAGMDMMTEAFLEELKEIAAETDLSAHSVYTLGERAFIDGVYDLGKILIEGTEANFTVYWFARPMTAVDFYGRIAVVRSGDEWAVTGDYLQRMNDIDTFGVGESKIRTVFNSASNESLSVFSDSFNYGYGNSDSNTYIRSYPNDDGSHTVIQKSTSTGTHAWSGISVAWGNDTMGGVVREDGDVNDSYASEEFYNQDGSLVKQSWGWSTYDTYGIDWVEQNGMNIAGLPGFASAPEILYMIDRWDGSTQTRYVSTDATFDAATDEAVATDRWDIYFKSDTAVDGVWAAGDTIYNWESSTSGYDGSVWQNVTTFTKGYEVPTASTALTADFYFEDRYPLKSLLPLTGAYDGMQIVELEGETFTDTWTDPDGNEQSWSWTDYTYFIDADGDAVLDQSAESQDLTLYSIWMDEHWLWDPATFESSKVKAPFFTTTGGRLPSYFSSPDTTLVDTVKARIDLVYAQDVSAMNPADHASDLMDPAAVPQFAQLEY